MLDTQLDKAKALAMAVVGDTRGQSASGGVGLVVTLTVAALVAAFLIPVAIDELVSVDTSSWGSGASSLWEIMDLIVVLAIFLFMIGLAISRSNM
jgi:hypothetical protein